MEQYISKTALIAEVERIRTHEFQLHLKEDESAHRALDMVLGWLDKANLKEAMFDCQTCANYNKECYPYRNKFKCDYDKMLKSNPTKKDCEEIQPKFKVGNWIIFNGLTLCINEVVTGYYRTISIGGIPCSYDWDIDNIARLWTIQDAKDGDVLCYETKDELRIFIYKNGHIHYHCCYYNGHLTTVDSFFVVEKYLLCYIHPATKEQRDVFFRSIHESNFAWNSESKKLLPLNALNDGRR